MDKNTIIGFVLIGIVVLVFSWLNQPTPEQLALRQRNQDSLTALQQDAKIIEAIEEEKQHLFPSPIDPSAIEKKRVNALGTFASSAEGKEEFSVLENEKLRLKFSNKGGRIVSAELKDYKTFDSLPLFLFKEEDADYGFTLITSNNRIVQTNQLFFDKIEENNQSIIFRLKSEAGGAIDFLYSLLPNSFAVNFKVVGQGLENVLSASTSYLDFNWCERLRQQERGTKFEDRYAQLYYKFWKDDVEYLSESKDVSKALDGKVKWIDYKDQFFSSILIAKEGFKSVNLESKLLHRVKGYLKEYKTLASVDFSISDGKPLEFMFYLCPNQYSVLKEGNKWINEEEALNLERVLPLGWGIFRWVNTYFIIPLFNFFGKFIGNYGIIILLLTIVVRIVISPMSYRSNISSAKMRLLRPQVEEINKKYPGDDKAMDRQKATMDLYNKAGASPMSGCLPMLLQMPVLFAMFTFFPSAIELRQESFLWAKDLSSYDAIVTWDAQIPFISQYYGNHISLFCLLMAITNIIYTKYNMDSSNTGQQQMPSMKFMTYIMPLMFLVFFNQYASGLCYYYFLTSLFGIIERLAFTHWISEEKLYAEMKERVAHTSKHKKSGFWAKLEEAQRQQEKRLREQQRKR